MAERTRIVFVSDVHLGFKRIDPAERERRFVTFLQSLEEDTKELYMLGDIWDFWYEYRYVIPKEGIRVTAELLRLLDLGVKIYAVPGNHDVWYYHFFQEIGITVIGQPYFVELNGRTLCIGHGDNLYGATRGYRLLMWAFHNKVLQWLFSTLHPLIGFKLGTNWSRNNRAEFVRYEWKGEAEPLYTYCANVLKERKVDYFVFGHFHTAAQQPLPGGAELFVIKDWIGGGVQYGELNGPCFELHSQESRF